MSDRQHLRTANLSTVIDRYVLELQIANRSPRTIEVNSHKSKGLAHWLTERGIDTINALTAETLQGYRSKLFHHAHAGRTINRSDRQSVYQSIVLGGRPVTTAVVDRPRHIDDN